MNDEVLAVLPWYSIDPEGKYHWNTHRHNADWNMVIYEESEPFDTPEEAEQDWHDKKGGTISIPRNE